MPAASYNFNSMTEIKSHSSILYNERMAILFYLLDMKSMRLNVSYTVNDMLEVRTLIRQIYKNVRTLIRNNPTVRATLHLETKDPGIYTTDVALGMIDKMVEYCESNTYTPKRLYIMVEQLNNFEMLIKDILQYFNYFIRPDFRQKPDIDMATENYKAIADSKTIEELKNIVGKGHRIDFDSLGFGKIESLQEQELIEDKNKEDEEADSFTSGSKYNKDDFDTDEETKTEYNENLG
jgi:hypothetical protein